MFLIKIKAKIERYLEMKQAGQIPSASQTSSEFEPQPRKVTHAASPPKPKQKPQYIEARQAVQS